MTVTFKQSITSAFLQLVFNYLFLHSQLLQLVSYNKGLQVSPLYEEVKCERVHHRFTALIFSTYDYPLKILTKTFSKELKAEKNSSLYREVLDSQSWLGRKEGTGWQIKNIIFNLKINQTKTCSIFFKFQ